jgi:hypothetical protein
LARPHPDDVTGREAFEVIMPGRYPPGVTAAQRGKMIGVETEIIPWWKRKNPFPPAVFWTSWAFMYVGGMIFVFGHQYSKIIGPLLALIGVSILVGWLRGHREEYRLRRIVTGHSERAWWQRRT